MDILQHTLDVIRMKRLRKLRWSMTMGLKCHA